MGRDARSPPVVTLLHSSGTALSAFGYVCGKHTVWSQLGHRSLSNSQPGIVRVPSLCWGCTEIPDMLQEWYAKGRHAGLVRFCISTSQSSGRGTPSAHEPQRYASSYQQHVAKESIASVTTKTALHNANCTNVIFHFLSTFLLYLSPKGYFLLWLLIPLHHSPSQQTFPEIHLHLHNLSNVALLEVKAPSGPTVEGFITGGVAKGHHLALALPGM